MYMGHFSLFGKDRRVTDTSAVAAEQNTVHPLDGICDTCNSCRHKRNNNFQKDASITRYYFKAAVHNELGKLSKLQDQASEVVKQSEIRWEEPVVHFAVFEATNFFNVFETAIKLGPKFKSAKASICPHFVSPNVLCVNVLARYSFGLYTNNNR